MPDLGGRSLFGDRQPAVAHPPRERIGSAFGVSIAVHAAILAASLLAVAHVTGPVSNGSRGPLLPQVMVWLNEPGPGGGGGGGGNRMQEPPKRLEVRGEAQLSMPARKPLALASSAEVPDDAPALDQHVVVPVQFSGASLDTRPGTLDGAAGTSASRGPGSGPGAGSGRGAGAGDGDGPGIGDGWGGGTDGGYYQLGAGIETPEPIKKVKPLYTNEAMRQRIRGTAWIECIVLPDGTVGRLRIIRSLDPVFGLDEEALKAAKQWRFRPGRRNGQPVAVLVTIALDFNVR